MKRPITVVCPMEAGTKQLAEAVEAEHPAAVAEYPAAEAEHPAAEDMYPAARRPVFQNRLLQLQDDG